MPQKKMSMAEYHAAKDKDKPESQISKDVKTFVQNFPGADIDRLNSGKLVITSSYELKRQPGTIKTSTRAVMLSKKGTPDLLAIYFGRAIYIETKISGKLPKAEQFDRQAELKAAGARVINADSFRSFETQWLRIVKEIKDEISLINTKN